MRTEFELLDSYFKRLYANYDIGEEFLRKVWSHIVMCEQLVDSDKEQSVIKRTVHWWNRRADQIGMTSNKSPSKDEISEHDRNLLRSMRIKNDFSPKDEDLP